MVHGGTRKNFGKKKKCKPYNDLTLVLRQADTNEPGCPGFINKDDYLEALASVTSREGKEVILKTTYVMDDPLTTEVNAAFLVDTSTLFSYTDEEGSLVTTGIRIQARDQVRLVRTSSHFLQYSKLQSLLCFSSFQSFFKVTCPTDSSECELFNFNAGFNWVPAPTGPFAECNEVCGCYPTEATVIVEGKGGTSMGDLRVGDKVLASRDTFRTVYAFGHFDRQASLPYLQLHFEGHNDILEIYKNHMLFKQGHANAVTANTIRKGDRLVLPNDDVAEVKKVDTVERKGLFLPLTNDGTLVVNGVLTSAYVSSFFEDDEYVNFFGVDIISVDLLMHVFFTPVRLVYNWVSHNLMQPGDGSQDHFFHPYLLSGRNLLIFGNKHPVAFFFFFPPILAALIVLSIMETYGATLFFLGGVGFAAYKTKFWKKNAMKDKEV